MRIVAHARLHLSLADMGYASARSFGGVGFSITHPCTTLDLKRHEKVELDGLHRLDEEARNELTAIANRLRARVSGGFRMKLDSSPPQHVGFGTKTSLSLGLIAGVNALYALHWPKEEMQRLSGRGGASGVGIHAFFDGGVIWDGGHSSRSTKMLAPSGAAIPNGTPPLMLRFPFPDVWRIILILPDEKPMSGPEEEEFFAQNAPIPREQALSTMAALYHGVLPAMKLTDYAALAAALQELHSTGFKHRESRRWSCQTQNCLKALENAKLAVGMSSVGPLIYVIIRRDDRSAISQVRTACSGLNTRMIKMVNGWNSSYEIRQEYAT
jgi:beta-ribofuranosylaminobenzene 5'-phosphate synthase